MGGMNATIQKMPTRDAWSEEAELRVTGTAGALHSNELWASRKRRLSKGVAGVWSITRGMSPKHEDDRTVLAFGQSRGDMRVAPYMSNETRHQMMTVTRRMQQFKDGIVVA